MRKDRDRIARGRSRAADRSLYFGLNSVGTRIWELIIDRKSRAEIVEALLVEHDAVRADVERDVDTLAGELESNGLIRRYLES